MLMKWIHWHLITIWSCIGIAVGLTDQQLVDYLSQKLQIQYTVLSNMESSPKDGGPRSNTTLQITNIGNLNITDTNWEIYLCSVRIWEPDVLKTKPRALAKLGGTGLQVEHISGCLHRLTARDDFKGFLQQMTLLIPFQTSDWQAARTDISPNWYVAYPGTDPQVLFYTQGEELNFVEDFTTSAQWKRREYDSYRPYSAQDRYRMNKHVNNADTEQKPVIPTPVTYNKISDKILDMKSSNWQIITSSLETSTAARFLSEHLLFRTASDRTGLPTSHFIYLQLGSVKEASGKIVTSPEAYHLATNAQINIITITGAGVAGLLYGVQTLISITQGDELFEVDIVDYPRFGYRGMHVDVARNFQPKSTIISLLNAMAMYKLNKLHLHLTDDEGWRLQIPGLQELTEIGGQRCHDLAERGCIVSQLGSGPSPDNSGSGFYTVDDYRDILRYAQDRAIEVIPEFDMPGHGHAAIKAMEARYWRLYQLDEGAANEFLLSDLEDASEYLSVQSFRDNAINPCIMSTYNFIRKIIVEVKALHADIQPLRTFHFGGDEVPDGAWQQSPACEMESDSTELKKRFVEQVSRLVRGEGLSLAGWEDGLMWNASVPFDRSLLANPEVYGYAWNNIWEWGGGSRAYVLANNGYKVILSHATDLYFDHPHEPDPEERGFYWATRYTDTQNVFNYNPSDIYKNIQVDLFGKPLQRENICRSMGCTQLEPGKDQNIVGIQGQLWSETVRTPEQLFSMVFPRLVALAERAWHLAPWESMEDPGDHKDKDWAMFAHALGSKELARLDKIGITYNIPCPGAVISKDGVLHVSTSLPGLSTQYSIDAGESWSVVNGQPTVPHNTMILLKTSSSDGSRTSRTVSISSPRSLPSPSSPADPAPSPPASSATKTLHSLYSLLVMLLVLITFACAEI